MLLFLSMLNKAPDLEFCWPFVFWLPQKFFEEALSGNSMILEMVELGQCPWSERPTASALFWLTDLRAWASLAANKELAFEYLALGFHYGFLLLLKFCFWGVSFSQSSILDSILSIKKLLWGQYIPIVKNLNRTRRLYSALQTPSSLILYRNHHLLILGSPRHFP